MHAPKRGPGAARVRLSIVLAAVLVASVLATGSEVAHAATAPSAPTAANAVAGDALATVSWSAPASNGGAAITGYVVTPWVGYYKMPSRTFASTATSQVLTGLTRTWSYRFTVSAINSVGTSAASALTNAVVPVAPSTASPTAFVHPGVLVGKADLDFVRAQVAAGREPWRSAFNNVLASYSSESTARRPTRYRYSSLSYKPAPVTVVQAGGNESYLAAHPELGGNIGGVEHLDDAQAAYTHALLWYYTGNRDYATKAKEILNAWSLTLREIKFDQPRRVDNGSQVFMNGKLQAGWGASLLTRAAEIIRYTGAGWPATAATRFETMLRNVYLPHVIGSWNNTPNWIMTFAEATIGIGVFTNDRATFDAGVAAWRAKAPTTIYMASDGPLPVSPADHYETAAELKDLWYDPTSFVTGLQGETLRDISHMAFGMGAMSNAAQTAAIQGVDLYRDEQARIVAAYERNAGYVNQYLDKKASLGGAEPPASWKPVGWVGPEFVVGGLGYRGGWEVAYRHYALTVGISMPQTAKLVARLRPTQPLFHTTWETLTHAK